MPNLERKKQKVFAQDASNNGQFGSLQAGTKILDNDIDVIQALAAFLEGWSAAAATGEQLPALEEFQALHYLTTRQLSYLLDKGIPEWEAGTEYFIGDIQRDVAGNNLYRSITDNNTGNLLTDVVNWVLLGDLADLSNIVQPASQPTVTAGVVDDEYVAPSTLLGLFAASSQGATSSVRLPINVGGEFKEIIIQMGKTTVAGESSTVVALPTAYPTTHIGGWATFDTINQNRTDPASIDTASLTQIVVGNSFSASESINWVSIGF